MRKYKKTVRVTYAAATVLLAAALLVVGGSGGVASGQQQTELGSSWQNADVALKQPTVIPHPIYPTPCVTCHKPRPTPPPVGAKPTTTAGVGGIPMVPHKPYPNCLQCHVPAGKDIPPFRGNTFGQKRIAPGGKKPDASKPKPAP